VSVTARFIGGTGRCGTAMLGAVFAAHPETTYFREPRFISDPGGLAEYVQGKTSLAEFKRRMGRHFWRSLVNKTRLQRELSTQDIRTVNLAREPYAGRKSSGELSIQDVYAPDEVERVMDETMDGQDRAEDGRRFLHKLFSLAGSPYWVEKTPHTVRFVDTLYKMFDGQMRYLHLIREPKDIFASFLQQRWGPKNVSGFTGWYSMIMTEASVAFQQVPRRYCKVVEMEHLAASPCDVLPEVFAFFEIPAEPGWIFDVSKTISLRDAHIGRHANEITRDAKHEIDRVCGELYAWWKEWE